MKFILRFLILILRQLSRNRYACKIIYDTLQKLPFSSEKIQNAENYIFGKVQLRALRKGRMPGANIKKTTQEHKLTFKRFIFVISATISRLLNKIGFEFLTKFYLYLVSKTSISEDRKLALYDLIYFKDSVSNSSYEDCVLLSKLKDEKKNNKCNEDYIKELQKFNVLHVFIDGSASLPKYLSRTELSHLKLQIYSFSDQNHVINKLGLQNRTLSRSLRDRFNEIAPEGVEAFEFSKKWAADISFSLNRTLLSPIMEISDNQKEVISLSLDSIISKRLSFASCLRNGIREVPKSDAVLFVAFSDAYIVNGWNFLRKSIDNKRTFVSFMHPKSKVKEDFWKKLTDKINGRNDIKSIVKSDNDPEKLNHLKATLSTTLKMLEESTEDYVNEISLRLAGDPALVIAHAGNAKDYRDTYEAIGMHAVHNLKKNKDHSIPVFLHCTGVAETEITPKLLKAGSKDGAISLDLGRLDRVLSEKSLTQTDLEIIDEWFLSYIASGKDNAPLEVVELIQPLLPYFFKSKLRWVFAGYIFGKHFGEKVLLFGTLASTSRNTLVRSVCAGILDSKQKYKPLIDVQSLNVLGHPKYRRPMANHCSVIDNSAKKIYQNYLGVPESQIHVVGAPQNDNMQKLLRLVDNTKIKERLGIDTNQKVILLISQLQPFERMSLIAKPLGEMLKANPNLTLIVRLHPREISDRKAAYKDLLDQYARNGQLVFSRNEAKTDILAISDVCVTIYSNMAREAAIAGKTVILANFIGWKPPIRLDKEGLAKPSINVRKFKQNINDNISKTNDSMLSNPYLSENPHILEGNSVKQIFAILKSKSNIESKLRTSLITPVRNKLLPKGLRDCESIAIVMTTEKRVADLPPIFSKTKELTVFNSRTGMERGFLPPHAVIEAGVYNVNTSKQIDQAVIRGNKIATKCVKIVLEGLKEHQEIYSIVKKLEYPFWMRLRPRLIRAERNFTNLEMGINHNAKGIVLCSSDNQMLEFLAKYALDNTSDEKLVFVLDLSIPNKSKLLTAERYLNKIIPKEVKEPTKVSPKYLSAALDGLSEWLISAEKFNFNHPSGPKVLVTTDWRLKTVPPTLSPVIKELAKNNTKVMFANRNSESKSDIEYFAGNTLPYLNAPKCVLSPIELTPDFPNISPRHRKTILRIFKNLDFNSKELKNTPPNVRKIFASNLQTIARTWLVETIAWFLYCKEWFKNGEAVSLASPGRQWHSEVAHIAADDSNCLSMTVQNAYMTGGYSYTKPTGAYITAIDTWTKEIYTKYFNVDEKRISITSTPRFDYLKNFSSTDQSAARKRLNITPNHPFIFFAAQIGLEEDAERIIKALATIGKTGGKHIQSIVKLHPRSPVEDIMHFESVANNANMDHQVSIVNEGEISDFLIASDIVITVYSNVGIEATIARKNLIIAKFRDEPLPLPLEEFDIGFVAKNEEEIKKAILSFFEKPNFVNKYQALQEKYCDDNPAMVEGTSTSIISETLISALNRKGM